MRSALERKTAEGREQATLSCAHPRGAWLWSIIDEAKGSGLREHRDGSRSANVARSEHQKTTGETTC